MAALLMKGYLTLKEMAGRLGYRDESALRHAIRDGRLAAEMVGHTLVVSDEEYERFASTTKPRRGWPRGNARKPKTEEPTP